MAEEAKR
jgi:hypothetical protein